MDRIGLITLRLKANLRQYELAQLLRVHPTIICDLERGRRLITPEIVERIKKVIDEAKSTTAKA